MTGASRARVRGTRTATLIASWSVFSFATLALLSNLDSVGVDTITVILSVVWSWFLAVSLRSLYLGVWTTETGIECVTWFRRISFKWNEFDRLLADPYAGFMSKGASSALLAQVAVITTSGRSVVLHGLVGFSGRVRAEMKRVTQYRAGRLDGPPSNRT